MIKFLALALLCIVGTVILFAAVAFEDPPSFVAYTFGVLNGASVVGLIALWLIRRERQ